MAPSRPGVGVFAINTEGRIAASALMVIDISIFGLKTANVSARFVAKRNQRPCPYCGERVDA